MLDAESDSRHILYNSIKEIIVEEDPMERRSSIGVALIRWQLGYF